MKYIIEFLTLIVLIGCTDDTTLGTTSSYSYEEVCYINTEYEYTKIIFDDQNYAVIKENENEYHVYLDSIYYVDGTKMIAGNYNDRDIIVSEENITFLESFYIGEFELIDCYE